MIIFENDGELDPRLITTIGVNVKPASTNPIGYFGTGLKYAIAIAMREGLELVIQSGTAEFTFAKQTAEINASVRKIMEPAHEPSKCPTCGQTLPEAQP